MKDSRILSSFQELYPGTGTRPLRKMPEHGQAHELVFDTCQVGVVLRAVLFVQAIVLVASLFESQSLWGLMSQMAMLTGAALPAVLAWLLVVCMLKQPLGYLPMPVQWTAGVALGALAALYGCGLLSWMGLLEPAPWLGSAASGALGAAVLVAGLVWRAKARSPAPPRPPRRSWPSCRRASGRSFFSTRSTARSRWCAPNRPRPRVCWKT